jgi:hypothetical protein
MKKEKFLGILVGLIVLLSLMASSCREAPDDIIDEIITKNWTVSINGSAAAHVGDTVKLTAVLTGASYDKTRFSWVVIDPDGVDYCTSGKTVELVLTNIGEYFADLEATNTETKKTATASFKLTVTRRGIIISLGQTEGNYLTGDNLKFDSLVIFTKLVTASDESLGRFILNFGDGFALDTVINNSQTVLKHQYSNYGDYKITFLNSEYIEKTFTITDPNPDDTTTVYDVDINQYHDLAVATTYSNAMFAKVDSINKKFYLLISVAATERTIGPQTQIILKGNWNGSNYSEWSTYITGTAKSLIVTTSKGRYIRLEIKNYNIGFEYRGNIIVNTNDWINAQNMAPFYRTDSDVFDTGSIHFIIKNDNKIHPPQ